MGMNFGFTISIHTFDLTTGKIWSGAKVSQTATLGRIQFTPSRSEQPIPRIVQVRVDL